MTQQTTCRQPDIADIVKPLEWTGNPYRQLKAETPLGIYVIIPWKGKFEAEAPDFNHVGIFTTDIDAEYACQKHYVKAVSSILDHTKLHPEPFWKPIEQCPRVEGARYDLWVVDEKGLGFRLPDCTYKDVWRDSIGDNVVLKITHFAEIPPCEVQP